MNKNVIRKLSSTLAVLFIVPILLSSMSFAADDSKIYKEMAKTDNFVMTEILQTISKVNTLIAKENQPSTDLQEKIEKIVADLQEKALDEVNKLIIKAAKVDIVIVNEYIDVEIGGKIYQVDPFRVLR